MFYSLAFLVYMIAASPVYLLRIMRGRYRSSIPERMGIRVTPLPIAIGPSYWVHACSVGEVEAAAPLVAKIRSAQPESRIVISTVTETGQARAKALFAEAHRIYVRYLPFDFRTSIRRHLDAVGELYAFIIMETEIWPNLIAELSDRMIPIHIVNGRISDHSWPRYRRWAFLFRPVLAKVAHVMTRTVIDEDRYRAIGSKRVTTVGNLKFDREIPPPPVNPPRGRFVIFASTHAGEEELLLRVFVRLKRDFPELRAIVAPRKLERASEIATQSPLASSRRSSGWGDEDLLILDTHGELAGMYAVSDVAFIGGSLIRHGGHNPLEAAVHGVPTIWGPHIFNFRDACGLLLGHGGFLAETEDEIHGRFRGLLVDQAERRKIGAKARGIVLSNRGAADRVWEIISRRDVAGALCSGTIAVRAPNWLGDAVMSLPAIRALEAEPGCEIVVIARPSVARVYRDFRVLESRGSYDPSVFRASRANTVILMTNSFSTALATRVAGIPRRIGYRMHGRGALLTDALRMAPGPVHQIERYNRLMAPLGVRVNDRRPTVTVARAIGESNPRTVVLAPGVKYGSAKRWNDFDRLGHELVARDHHITLLGFRDECLGFDFPRGERVTDLLDRTDLDGAIDVLSKATAVVANDSGIAHLSAALGRPTIVLFGAHDPRLTAPPGAIVIEGRSDCSPCMLRNCPIDHRCMKSITVEAVLTKLEAWT